MHASAVSVRLASAPMGRPGRLLVLARIGWCLGVALGVAAFVTGIPATFVGLHSTCANPSGAGPGCTQAQLTPPDFRALGGPNAATAAYAVYTLSVILTASLLFFAVGGLIAWRKRDDPMGWFVSLVLMTFGGTGISNTITHAGLVLLVVGLLIAGLQYPLLAIFLLTFPTGRFAPRWSALLIVLWIVLFGLFVGGAPEWVTTASTVITWGSVGAIQIYRYARLYTPTQRQQTKWVVYGLLLLSVLLQGAYAIAPRLWPWLNSPGSPYRLARFSVIALSWMPISLCVGIAILRTHLYDIDVLIRRTLVYGTLTASLGGVYFGSVIGLQTLAQALTGQRALPPVAVVASTLLIAALFTPLRRRIQATIDRRFYRRRYNAAKTIADFSHAMRDDLDLTDLAEQLLAVVERAMEPAHLSLWLAPPHDVEATTRTAVLSSPPAEQ
jgi:hypothetical protein